MRRFSQGSGVLSEYFAGQDFKTLGGICVRSSVARYRDASGIWQLAAINEARDKHFIGEVGPYLLHEGVVRTNSVTRSYDLTVGWTGAATAALNAVGIDGVANHATTLTDDDGAVFENKVFSITVPNDSNTHAFEIWIKKDSDQTRFPQIGAGLSGGTAVQWRASLNTATGAFVAANVLGAGVGTVRDDGLWWIVSGSLPNNTTGNTTLSLVVYPAARSVISGPDNAAATGSVGVGHAQAELNAGFCTSPIITTGAVGTRNSEQNSLPWDIAPQEMTGYADIVDLGWGQVAQVRLWQISGPNDLGPRHLVYVPSTVSPGTTYHQNANGGSAVTSGPAGAVSYGNRVEYRSVLHATGAVSGGKSVNNGAEVTSGPSGVLALAGAWGSTGTSRLYIGSTGAGTGGACLALRAIRFVPGVQTMASMRYHFLSAIKSESAEFVHLLEFDFSGGLVHLTTGAQDLSWNGVTWEAVGGLLEMSGVEETNDPRGQGVDLRLSGVDQTMLSALFNNNYRGRPVKIYRAHLNRTTGKVVSDPLLLFQGLQLNPYTVEEERDSTGGTVRISTRLAGYFGVERVRGIQANLISHQHHFPGDLFFQHAASLRNVKIYWGTPIPQTPGGGRKKFPDGFVP